VPAPPKASATCAFKASPAHISHERRTLVLLAMKSVLPFRRGGRTGTGTVLNEEDDTTFAVTTTVPPPPPPPPPAAPLLRFESAGNTDSATSLNSANIHRLRCEAAVLLLGYDILGSGVQQEQSSGSSLSRPSSLGAGYFKNDRVDSLRELGEGALDRICLEAAELLGFDVSAPAAEDFLVVPDDDCYTNQETAAMIEITPHISLPLHGSQETKRSILQGAVLVIACSGCHADLTFVQQADWVVCSECYTFTSLSSYQGELDDPSGSVGLGIQAEMVHLIISADASGRRTSSLLAAKNSQSLLGYC
jgi:LSD1 subclass zinc finger protein